MKLTRTKTSEPVVGLDLAAGSIAATELRGNGAANARLGSAVVAPLEPGVFAEGEILDSQSLSASLKQLFGEHKLSKRVRLGLANQRVAVRSIRLPFVEDPEELETAVRFKAQDEIPMPVDQAVLDHRIVAHSQGSDGNQQIDVIVVAARREMIDSFLHTVREAGLKPAGFDLAAFGMIRALVDRTPVVTLDGEKREVPTTLYCSLGDGANLAFARGRSCLFTRVSPYGSEQMAVELGERTGLQLDHARQWLAYVGLETPVDQIDGGPEAGDTVNQAREVLEAGSRRLLDEIRLSLDFYGQQPDVPAVEEIVISGEGAAIPGIGTAVADGLRLRRREVSPPALEDRDDLDAGRLATSYGLALEE